MHDIVIMTLCADIMHDIVLMTLCANIGMHMAYGWQYIHTCYGSYRMHDIDMWMQAASDAMLTVTITDCNDHPPILSQSSYAFTIAERTAGPSADETVFSGISVTDNDASASNRAMQFEVVGDVATATNNWFDIDSATVSACDSCMCSCIIINDHVI